MLNIIKTAFPILFSSLMSLCVLMMDMRIVGRHHPENIYILGIFTPTSYLILAVFESFRALIIANLNKYKDSQILTQYLNAAILLSSFLFAILCLSAWLLKWNIFSVAMIAVSMVGCWSYILVSTIYVLKQRMVAIVLVVLSALLNISQVYIYFNYSILGLFSMPLSLLVTNIFICLYAARGMAYKNYFNIHLVKICIQDYLSQGVPVLVSYILLFIGIFWFNEILLKLGASTVSGFGIAYRLQTMAMLVAISIGSAMAIINNKKDGLILCGICYIAITLFIYIFKSPVISLITTNVSITQQANNYLSIVSPTYIFFSLYLSAIIYFEQTGRGLLGLVLNATYFIFIFIAQMYVSLYLAIAWMNVLIFFVILPFIIYSKGSDYAKYSKSNA